MKPKFRASATFVISKKGTEGLILVQPTHFDVPLLWWCYKYILSLKTSLLVFLPDIKRDMYSIKILLSLFVRIDTNI